MLTRRGFGMRVAAAIAALAAMVAVSAPAARADDKVVVFAAASLNAVGGAQMGLRHGVLRQKAEIESMAQR